MKMLVTGGTGFIGERFVKNSLEKGHDITCTVRKTSRTDHLKNAGVSLAVADISNAEEVDEVFSKVRPDMVVHAAANVGSDRDKLSEVNITGTGNICSACLKYGVKRLVYLSSVSVVSGNKQAPLTDDLDYKASNTYGESKIEAERIAVKYRDKGLPVAILRPCMVYGEGEPHAMDNILGMVSKRLVPVFSMPGLNEKLQLVHIDNVVQAMELALKNDRALEGTFIIADRDVISIMEFIRILSDELGVKPVRIPAWMVKAGLVLPPVKRKFGRMFKDRLYDISRAEEVLGYDPRVSTEEGLRALVRHWKETSKK